MQSPSSSCFDHPKMNYDVFISFRGTDVRYTFVGYLYEALNHLGIKAFVDDKKFKIGDDLHYLFQIIEESRSAIVVLSEDYASAKWCLRELTKIMDSMGTTMDRVLPVFYHVDPSTVKDQSGTFKKSFDEHEANAIKETDNQEKEKRLKDIQNWRKAMKKIGNRTGVEITKDSSEVEVVKKIAKQVFNTWRPKLEALDKNLVGMKSRLLQMNMHLALGLDDVRFVAIVGRGGMGKTTIVNVVFHCLLPMFEDHCYMKLSGEGNPKQSLVSLQHQMLSSIFYTENFRIWNEKHGMEMIKNRLSGRKVLLVLDGIEEKKQLDKLAGSIDWFGPGSRVVITTRNKELLHRPNNVEMKEYNVEQLDHDSALQLFLKHAFDTSQLPNKNFMDLSSEMVEKVERLPLALEVIGSFLYHKEIDIWIETLKRLIKVDERNFFDVLKISYDGLGVESQQVFLDLACFFHGKRKDRVLEILESFGYSPKSEILLLMERCLIKVTHEKILMHDLILEMGREIVHKESLVQPYKQSRIWLQEDLYRIFAEKHGLTYIQGIVLSMEKEKKESIQLNAKSFLEMTSLRILEIDNVELVEDIEYLSQLLRLINWPGCPLKYLPQTFQSRYLFELLLPHSCILQLWEGKKNFEKLKVIDASNSEDLCMTPDFSGVPNLERLVLRNCVNLCEVHPSINCLNNLILLDLNGCVGLKLFPPNIRCRNLQTLDLSSTCLESSPEIGKSMERLTHLHLCESNVTQLHPSIGYLIGLVLLDLNFCISLSNLPCEIGNLRSLKKLSLRGCIKLDQIPPSLANIAQSLEILNIADTSITHAASSICCLRNLEILDCGRLSSGIWRSLLPISSGLECLKTLNLCDCRLVDEDVPEDLHCFCSLEKLYLCHNDFVKLPDSLSHLKKLKKLYLNGCTKLKDLPKLPPSLQFVEGKECRSISEQFYNKRLHMISSTSQNSLELNFSILSEETTTGVECTVNKSQHLNFDRRLFEVNISDEQSYYFTNNEVDAFDQINEGNWINIEYNQESSLNNDISNVCGVFLLANIESQQTLHHFKFNRGNFSVHLEIDGNPSNFLLREFGEFKVSSTKSIGIVYIPIKTFSDRLKNQNSFSIKATMSCNSIYVKVKACDASIICSKNASEYLAKLFTKLYCSQRKFHRNTIELNHKSECMCDELEVAKDDVSFESSGTTDSTCFLRNRNLKPILGRIFQEENNYNGSYFFPHIIFFGWFKNQKDKNKVAVKLPVNIHKDKKWMGLAMFAIFSISENANCHCFDYEIQSDDGRTLSKHNCFIPIELLEYSNQILLIVFEPRNWYPYELNSSSNHVYISFNTNAERMQVEMCGARLVYNQNVEGLVQTIVDCIVESGADLYEYYNQQVMGDLLSLINLHKHHESSQQTSGSSSTDSSFSVEQLLHGSFPHPLFHKSIQERFGSKFDLILPGDMIPEFFNNQSTGNMGGIKLPQYWDHNPNCDGLAVCALVVVDKEMRKLNDLQEPERYTKVVDLICKFRVDSDEIEPVHYHFVSQEKLLSEYASHFIWLFYTPLTEFYILWHNCNYIGMTLETSCDELFRVQHCGLHLISKKERKEIDQMIMESAIPPSITHNQKGSQQ